ncbi:MAG: polysaccharide deacetylase family protein [Acidobacteriota bacterium]|nr:polysaccharide deacetylase family protein [Acidobacteriota bacterium]
MFDAIRNSNWRRNRLLILCYHGVSLDNEHLWRPGLYMQPSVLEQRLEMLKRGGYSVLRLGEALQKLEADDLPPRSVVITFDDGAYDFYDRAYPLLERYDFPATVYLTTYYSGTQRPIFNLICSYMLWTRRGLILDKGKEIGLPQPMNLKTELNRHKIVCQLNDNCEANNLTGSQKDAVAGELAKLLDIDYAALKATRLLQIMAPHEIAQLASKGVDFQLHTHRHRVPVEERLFRKEIEENRERIRNSTNSVPVHFCYPSGVYHRQFLCWLEKENVISATTCDVGLVTKTTNKLLLPRFIDTYARTPIEFESWLTGVGSLMAIRRSATQVYRPAND